MSVLVSIICATFNRKDFIRPCLDGLVMQETTFEYEILVNDDASTDGTAAIVREYAARYPDKIKAVLQQENQYSKGVEISLGILYPMARGKYIAECEGDDYWTHPGKLQMQVDYLERHPECPLCYTKAHLFDHPSGTFRQEHIGFPYKGFEAMLSINPVPAMTACFRREALERYIQEVNPLSHHWATADYPKWLFFAQLGPLGFIDEFTGVYRDKSPASISNPRNFGKRYAFLESVYDIKLFFAKRGGCYDKMARLLQSEQEKACIEEATKYGSLWRAWGFLLKARCLTRWERKIYRRTLLKAMLHGTS